MVKQPRPGRVKTRLAAGIGPVAATWWFRHQTRRLLRRLQDKRWALVLAVAPDTALASRDWPSGFDRIPQGRGNLGERMRRAMRQARFGPVCVIGADIPGIRRNHVARAFAVLGSHDAVFGPAPDGGYWLVGLRHPARMPWMFLHGVRWSTAHALSDSLTSCKGLRIAMAATLRDVDSVDDLAFADDAARHP